MMNKTSNEKVRICFLGTPEFAAQHLKSILQNSNYQVVGVVTQPDRPAGRKMQLTPSPVKVLALENHLPVLTPESLKKDPQSFETIKKWNADLAVVVAFGQILTQEFLDSFKWGAVNVHGSLLPKWRGAAPIQRSIEAGDTITGICLQKMVKKLDAGDLIAERVISLDSEINATELYDRMSVLGCELVNNELLKYVQGEINLKPQDENFVTYAHKIEKEESKLDPAKPAVQLHNKVRAFTMGPGTYFLWNDKRIKIHKTKIKIISANQLLNDAVLKNKILDSTLLDPAQENLPAFVVQAQNEQIQLLTGSIEFRKNLIKGALSEVEVLEILELQPESKPKMKTQDFLKAHPLNKGEILI